MAVDVPLDFKMFQASIAKKNGKPKVDMPSLDYGQNLRETGVANISLKIIIPEGKPTGSMATTNH